MNAIWQVFFASGYFLKMALFCAVFLLITSLHGAFWSHYLKLKTLRCEFPGIGLVSVLALEEFFCWPMMIFRLGTGWLTGATLAVLLAPCAAVLCTASGRKRMLTGSFDRKERLLAAAVAVLLLSAAMMSAFRYEANSDDALYVSNAALFKVSARVNPYDASMGDKTIGTIPMYDFQVWEALLSVICRLFGLKASETMHTLAVIPLFFCSASASFCLGRALLQDRRKACVFLAAMTVYHLGCQVSYSEGRFLLGRIWQGKTVNLTVVLPVLSAMILTRFDGAKGGKSAPSVIVLMCIFAGMALNPTSLYINGFEMLFLAAAAMLARKSAAGALSLLPGVIVTLAFAAALYVHTSAANGIVESAGIVPEGFVANAMNNVFGKRKIFVVMYFGALIYMIVRGEIRARIYFIFTGILMLLFLWNPIAGTSVAGLITKTPTYWRVFWLVPIGPAIGWCAADLSGRVKGRRWAALALALICLIGYAGNWSMDDYTPADNVEKIHPKILEMGSRLVKDGVSAPVLACSAVSTTLRQEFTEIELLVSKESFVTDLYNAYGREEEGNDRLFLYRFANASLTEEECKGVSDLLDKYGVDCVILRVGNKTGLSCVKALGWKVKDKGDGFMMYCRPKK